MTQKTNVECNDCINHNLTLTTDGKNISFSKNPTCEMGDNFIFDCQWQLGDLEYSISKSELAYKHHEMIKINKNPLNIFRNDHKTILLKMLEL